MFHDHYLTPQDNSSYWRIHTTFPVRYGRREGCQHAETTPFEAVDSRADYPGQETYNGTACCDCAMVLGVVVRRV